MKKVSYSTLSQVNARANWWNWTKILTSYMPFELLIRCFRPRFEENFLECRKNLLEEETWGREMANSPPIRMQLRHSSVLINLWQICWYCQKKRQFFDLRLKSQNMTIFWQLYWTFSQPAEYWQFLVIVWLSMMKPKEWPFFCQ